MDDLGGVLTAVLPMLGVVVGAFLQYRFSRASERRKQTELLRDTAYADYLRAVALAAHGGQRGGSRRSEYLSQAADAKARIAIYGNTSVVEALARFERSGAALDTAARVDSFLELCQAMRAGGALGERQLSAADLRAILMGPEPAEDARQG